MWHLIIICTEVVLRGPVRGQCPIVLGTVKTQKRWSHALTSLQTKSKQLLFDISSPPLGLHHLVPSSIDTGILISDFIIYYVYLKMQPQKPEEAVDILGCRSP